MSKEKGIFVYEVLVPETDKGPGWLDLPFLGPERKDKWPDDFTPIMGLHVIRLQGPYLTYDKNGKSHRVPGQLFMTRKEIGPHLTTEFEKSVSRNVYQGIGTPKFERYRMRKVVKAKVRKLEEDEAAEAIAVGEPLAPTGEGFRFRRPAQAIGDEHCTWHPSLFTDQRGDVEAPPELLKYQGLARATLTGQAPEGAEPEPA